MHVMDTDCEKIGGGCLTAESAPELAKPSDSPLLVSGEIKTQDVHKVENKEEVLVNGSGDHHVSATSTVEETVTGKDEEEACAEQDNEEEKMEIVDDSEKGTKETLDVEEEIEGEEVAEDSEMNEMVTDEKVQLGDSVEVQESKVNINNEVEDKEEEEEEEEEVEEEVDEVPEECSIEETKELTSPGTIVEPAGPSEPTPGPSEELDHQKSAEEIPTKVVEPVVISNKTDTKSVSSPVAVPLTTQSKETKEEITIIPSAEIEEKKARIAPKNFSKEIEKRKLTVSDKEGEGEVSSGSESDSSRKKIKVEPDPETTASGEPSQTSSRTEHPGQVRNAKHLVDDDRERFIQEFISQCSQSVEEIDRAAEKLHKEVETLSELARAKELEWNAILRVRKMREEMLERLLRKRRLATEEYLDRTHLDNSLHNKNINKYQGNNQLMMVPIVSSSPGATVMGNRGPPLVRLPVDYGKQQRPILPKPCLNVNTNMVDPNCNPSQGRNGPIVDVKSIIADYSSGYRSRHPESVPRRGRRLRGGPIPEQQPPNRMSANPSLISMANMALGSGASIRTVNESPYNLSQDHSRPSSTDTPRAGPAEGGNMGYKDAVLQFAKFANQVGVSHVGKGPPNGMPQPPPPPYPEVTLHPVSRPGSSPPTPPTSSLLHGILTKSSGAMGPGAASSVRQPANFSPTLARLLTAPDRPPHPVQPPPHFRPQHPPRVSIADILSSSKKSRNEITITPVSGNPSVKPKEDVVMLQDDDEPEVSDRLVIDEGGDNEEVPQCQGCRQKPAQFVCAGCGNQWYCSRECQVTAWEEHSDVCSG
ncbi:hypothetical protein O3M35_001105 [Rhynocoris fuscipes]|uniref:MYND-type domain-containing protein n=1 Tax=Rhynocoris fuscipes TaxID=488301 RepID=A0AAW1DRK6_9HEMI